jgi:hypothetical protein
MTGNQQDLARFRGVNKSSVSRAVKAGRIKPLADGSFDFDQCAAAWHASSGGRADVAARHAAQRGRVLPTPLPTKENAPAADLAQVVPDDGSRAKAKALLMHYENSSIKLEMALRRGLRIELAAAKREAAGIGAMLRAGIERVIDQTAPRLAASSNELDRRRIVAAEVRRLRWMLKRELPRALRRMKDAGQKVGAGTTAE